MERTFTTFGLLAAGVLFAQAVLAGESPPPVVKVILEEALRANGHPDGRPLPLAAQWHQRHCPLPFQAELIRQGHHILPWVAFPHPKRSAEQTEQAYVPGLPELAAWKVPIGLIATQWESVLYDHQHERRWRYLPAPESPLVWPVEPIEGKPTMKKLSPFGAVEPWRQAGAYWTDTAAMRKLQELYPDPPRVLLISNNEASDLRWHEVEQSKRYVDKYGPGRSDDFKRKAVGDGWIERYRALLGGMREGLARDAWKKNSLFVAYNALGPDHFGRPDLEPSWKQWSSVTEDRIAWDWHAWQGAIPEAYDNHWEPNKAAFHVWSCQTEMMNLVFMRDEALRVNPDFWFEVIFWDGNNQKENDKHKRYAELGVEYTPELYRGWVQYTMWLLRPRVAREWRGSADSPRQRWWAYFEQIIQAVDRVHADGVLTRFWRRGQLVPNRAHEHPFHKDIPARWQKVDRWFRLDTGLDPERPWELTTRVPVYALAHVIGTKPAREWLVYAHAPMGRRKAVEVALPDYGKVKVDVAVGGSFYHVRESGGSIAEVGSASP